MWSRAGSGWRAGAGILAIAVGAGILGWFGYEEIEARLSTLWSGEAFHGDRLKLLIRGWSCLQQFPLWGTGYGTFEFIEPIYFHDPTDVGWVYEHAHNEYLHAALEGGAIRLLLSLAAIAVVYRLGWRALRANEATPNRGLILGGLFAFTTAVIHSFVEFGLHIPAIAILLAVLTAYLSGLGAAAVPASAARAHERGSVRREFSLPLPGGTPLLIAVAAILLGAVMVQADYDVDSADDLRRAARRLSLDGPDVRHQLAELSSLARLRTPDAELEMALGEGYLEYDRQVLKSGAASGTAAYRLKALWHFIRARDLCPILPVAHVRLAANRQHLRRGDPPEVYLERAKRVAPANPRLWFLCGTYELAAGRAARAWANWRRSLELSDLFLPNILASARDHLGPQEMLDELLPQRPGVLQSAARLEAEAAPSVLPGAAERREVFLRRALSLLQAKPRLAAAEWGQMAEIHAALGEPDDAIAAYRRALAGQPEHADWRYALAQHLYEQGRLDDARGELRIVLAYEPQHSRALALVKDVARRLAERAVESQPR